MYVQQCQLVHNTNTHDLSKRGVLLHFLPLAVPFRVRGQQGVFKVAVSPADFDVPVPIDTHLSLFTDADLDYMLARRNVTSQVLMRAAESARTNQYEAQFRREE